MFIENLGVEYLASNKPFILLIAKANFSNKEKKIYNILHECVNVIYFTAVHKM